jgi:hypothetical protein
MLEASQELSKLALPQSRQRYKRQSDSRQRVPNGENFAHPLTQSSSAKVPGNWPETISPAPFSPSC